MICSVCAANTAAGTVAIENVAAALCTSCMYALAESDGGADYTIRRFRPKS